MRSARMQPRVAVIGAGVAGLACARLLTGYHCVVTVYDKGRAPGGRISTRREDGVAFDHGAQYFTARHPRFRRAVQTWRAAGLLARWAGRIVALDRDGAVAACDPAERWVPMPSTSALARSMADGLNVVVGQRLTEVERRPDGWWLIFASGERPGPFDRLLLTVPAPQAAPLLACAPALAAGVAAVAMPPCWAVCLAPEQSLPLPWDGAFVDDEQLSWICRNSSKPGRGRAEAWVLHASADWSQAHLDVEPAAMAVLLARRFADVTGTDPGDPLVLSAHRWRYARVARSLNEPCLYDAETGIGAAGDWCLGGRVEGAFLSGESLAMRVLGIDAAAPTGSAQAAE
ncbi:MAG TPA: FAD-dependent oxidoreductase [Rhodospirillales bacterium]|nr:FAD-dependent oxidoreductase [Rhodospirillales bacterium]